MEWDASETENKMRAIEYVTKTSESWKDEPIDVISAIVNDGCVAKLILEIEMLRQAVQR